MQLSRTHTFLSITALCALLAACGGGGDDAPPAAETLPDLGACFTAKTGLRYTLANSDPGNVGVRGEYLKEVFDGTLRQAWVEYVDLTSDKRTSATYYSVESDGVRFWGDYDYAPTGERGTKSVYIDYLIPKTLAVGETVTFHYKDNNYFTGGSFLSQDQQETWTFEGHETLTLGGHTFTNACRLKTSSADTPEWGSTIVWVAPGYGPIQFHYLDVDGKLEGTRSFDSITEP